MRHTQIVLMLAFLGGAAFGCRAKVQEPSADARGAPAQRGKPASRPQPKEVPALSSDQRQLLAHFLPGCGQHGLSSDEELIVYCPEQAVFFAVRDLQGSPSPDQVFNDWFEELSARSGEGLELVERTESKEFGPQFVTLYVKLRMPDMPEEGYVEGFVARTEQEGQVKRVWCSATSSEQSGLARCRQDLMSVPVLTLR